MRVTFRYYAQVRRAAGTDSEPVEMSDATDLEAAFSLLAARHGPDFDGLVLDPAGRIRASLLVLVNGVPVRRDKSVVLADGDEVTVLSAVSGG